MTNNENPWESYTETVLYFTPEPQVFIDLRKAVSAGVRDALAEIGLSGEFSILTAYNPHGRNLSDEENMRRLAELEAELAESGELFVRVDACSPDGSHCEASFALRAPLSRAVDIADKWEQLAVFWFDGRGFWIVGCELRTGERIQLPVLRITD